MGVFFRVAPGVKLRGSRSRLALGLGPRSSRLWVGPGGLGISTGAGPVTLYRHLGGTSRTRRPTSMSAYEREARQARHVEELQRLAERLEGMLTVHQERFPAAGPPVAPPAEPVDVAAIRKRHRREARRGIPLYRLRDRREARRRADAAAEEEAAAERARRERERETLQRGLDEAWERLLANDPETVLVTLEQAFADNEEPATPVDCEEGRATVLMVMDGPDAVPERVPHLTPTGRPSSRKLTKTERNELHLGWISSNVLATMREAFAVAPALRAVTAVVLRRSR